MKSPISKAAKIGTVAGLAALAASESSQAAVVLSTFSNVSLTEASSSPITIDIDGNGTTDFTINGALYPTLLIQGNGASVIQDIDGMVLSLGEGYFHANGSPLPNGAGVMDMATLHSPPNSPTGEFYAGIWFSRNDETHLGWLQFQIPTNGTLNGALLVGGAWESTAYEGLTTGAVPEPSALVFSFTAGAAALLRRRRK